MFDFRVEAYNQENVELRRKMDTLESNNRLDSFDSKYGLSRLSLDKLILE